MEYSFLIRKVLELVKKNKKYNSISEEVILREIKRHLEKNKEIKKIDKQLIKDIRKQLHLSYASFQTKKKKKIDQYLNELKNILCKPKFESKDYINITNELLMTTLSTKERLNNYEEIYKNIFKITGKPKSVLDLGAGLNLFSFPLMNLKKLIYYAYDINEQDVKYLHKYFKIMKKKGLQGKAVILDVTDKKKLSKIPKCDIIFLFKLIDLIDKTNHKVSEELINYLLNNKTKHVVTSFAVKTITRKSMNFPKRKWFELMLKRNNLKFNIIKTNNEIFYIVRTD